MPPLKDYYFQEIDNNNVEILIKAYDEFEATRKLGDIVKDISRFTLMS